MSAGNKIKVCHVSTVHDRYDDRILLKECASLADAGYEVFFVVQAPAPEMAGKVQIVPLRSFESRISRVLFAPWIAFFTSLKTKAKVYHFHDPELIVLAPWYRIFGKKVIFDSHEDVPRQILSKNWISNMFVRKCVAAAYGLVEWWCILFCNKVISVTPEIVARFPRRKQVLVRNFPVLALAGMNEKPPVEKTKPVVIYAGGLSRIRGIKETIQAIESIDGKAELWLLGKWSDENYFEECKAEAGWKHTRYFGNMKPEEVYAYYHLADIGIALLYPEENYLKSLPVKAFEYMACGLPIIMSDFPYWQKNFQEGAIFVNPFNYTDISKAVLTLLSDNEKRMAMGAAGKKAAFEKFSWQQESQALINAYKELTGVH
jgi:glycosyltransferase involved in cell wall biosynthesis